MNYIHNKLIIITTAISIIAMPLSYVHAAPALSISDLSAEFVENNVIVSWRTNKKATGCVQYGLSSDYDWQLCAAVSPLEQHRIALINLQPKQVYHYRVISKTVTGTSVTSFDATIKTDERVDKHAPEISEVNLEYVGATIALITWKTDEPATSKVDYGATASYGSIAQDRRLKTEHAVTMKLKPATTYQYQVSSSDKAGNKTFTSNQSLRTHHDKTIDTRPLIIHDVRPLSKVDSQISDTTARITWRTSRPANGTVRYSTNPNRLISRMSDKNKRTLHEIKIENLRPGTTYYYQITSTDIFRKQMSVPMKGATYSFTTRGRIDPVTKTPLSSGETQPKAQPAVFTLLKDLRILGESTSVFGESIRLYKPFHSNKIYAVMNGQKHWIRSPEIFESYGYQWEDVRMISQAELDTFPDARLIKSPSSPAVYFLYPDTGIKISIPSEAVFNSYPNNKWEAIITVSEVDLAEFKNAQLVKLEGHPAIYLIEKGNRHPILSKESLSPDIDPAKAATINREHLITYPLGSPIGSL